jgi:hypothetical protein
VQRNYVKLGRNDVARFLVSDLPKLTRLILMYGTKFATIAGVILPKLKVLMIEGTEKPTDHAIPMSEVAFFMGLPQLAHLDADDRYGTVCAGSMPSVTFKMKITTLKHLELEAEHDMRIGVGWDTSVHPQARGCQAESDSPRFLRDD